MSAAKEKITFQLVARVMALLLLLAALAAPAQARSAAENRVWQKSTSNTESLHSQPLQLLEPHQVKAPVGWYDASDDAFAAENAAQQPIYVLGRQVDTAVAKDWAGHSVLDIPDWTIAKNDAWVQNIIDTRGEVYLGTPQSQATLWDAVNNRPTVFARELEQLRGAGYTQVGDYMHPPAK